MSVARHTGAPTSVINAYPMHIPMVSNVAGKSLIRSRRSVQNTTNARMLTFIPETTSTWYVPER